MIEQRNGTWFSIGVLTERYGAAAESFRNWERAGLIPPARRTPGGHRRYSAEHLEALDRLFGIARPERQREGASAGGERAEGDRADGDRADGDREDRDALRDAPREQRATLRAM